MEGLHIFYQLIPTNRWYSSDGVGLRSPSFRVSINPPNYHGGVNPLPPLTLPSSQSPSTVLPCKKHFLRKYSPTALAVTSLLGIRNIVDICVNVFSLAALSLQKKWQKSFCILVHIRGLSIFQCGIYFFVSQCNHSTLLQ